MIQKYFGNNNVIIEFCNESKINKKTNIKTEAKKRKIFAISMVKNEADIIESFVRYHCEIFDGIVIKDNNSSDATLKILQKLKEEGKNLYILKDNSIEFVQGIKMTKLLYYTLEKYDPDIIVPLDADEFLVRTDGKGNPIDILNGIDENKAYHVIRKNYIPNLSDDKSEKFIPKRIRYVRWDTEPLGKVIIPKKFALNNDIRISQGNHTVFIQNNGNYLYINNSIYDFFQNKDLMIAHYPIRSLEQLKSKVLCGWINALTRYDVQKPESQHWGELYKRIKNGEDFSQEDLINIAKNYALLASTNCDEIIFRPIDLSFCEPLKIKYTKDEEIGALKNVLENCELLAKKYGELKKEMIE
ncbi:glycosyltransferase family 2 protein [Paramaledivibacter caminithermalis]|jgi:hypothetical protein|uniref:Glycosyl transferase family 2 n=1 Tax=Paramaledivibacter caminithermalis (strain DSM 15212 / CIP 107654 / DViRD3) TaxID=1121301 RepID=A0A1M6JUD2_PARC5|nr:glycosyltransferase family 2 protein [Paramaledivibacter caminithermalis]SHJ50298.1 Glycosyl transferase family 2 [Paramaledivibacter caminithermalis DSM 15212]